MSQKEQGERVQQTAKAQPKPQSSPSKGPTTKTPEQKIAQGKNVNHTRTHGKKTYLKKMH